MEEMSILNIENEYYEITDIKARSSMPVTMQSTKFSSVYYTIVGDMMLVTGHIQGNDTSTIDLGIPKVSHAIPVTLRTEENGAFATYFIDGNGMLSGWDGWTARTFSSSYQYDFSFVARLKES